jgi:hypothetical protein
MTLALHLPQRDSRGPTIFNACRPSNPVENRHDLKERG